MAPFNPQSSLYSKGPDTRKPNNFIGQGRILGSGTRIGKPLSEQKKQKKALSLKLYTLPVIDDDDEEVIVPGDLKISAADMTAIEEARNHPGLKWAKDIEADAISLPTLAQSPALVELTSAEVPLETQTHDSTKSNNSTPSTCKHINDGQKGKKLVDTGAEGDLPCLCKHYMIRRRRAEWLRGLAEKTRTSKRSRK